MNGSPDSVEDRESFTRSGVRETQPFWELMPCAP